MSVAICGVTWSHHELEHLRVLGLVGLQLALHVQLGQIRVRHLEAAVGGAASMARMAIRAREGLRIEVVEQGTHLGHHRGLHVSELLIVRPILPVARPGRARRRGRRSARSRRCARFGRRGRRGCRGGLWSGSDRGGRWIGGLGRFRLATTAGSSEGEHNEHAREELLFSSSSLRCHKRPLGCKSEPSTSNSTPRRSGSRVDAANEAWWAGGRGRASGAASIQRSISRSARTDIASWRSRFFMRRSSSGGSQAHMTLEG